MSVKNYCGSCREIDQGYGLVEHPSDLESPSGNIIGKEKTDEESESELIDIEDYFRASLEDLFDDSYAEISYVICPKKWLQPDG